MKDVLSGNDAIARGFFEANGWVATGYPGTPSSEIVEGIGFNFPEVDSEWSVNEKVALEVAMGAAFAGVRSLCTMKHVGLNVAADPLLTVAYTGVNAGLVIVVADDPGMHSSQNEQDTRNYSQFAKIPLLDPSDSQEALDFTKAAFSVSEEFDVPVLLRPVTRVSHTRCIVELSEPVRSQPQYRFAKNPGKYVMMPAYAQKRHPVVLDRWEKLREYSERFPGNIEEMRGTEAGVITHGLTCQYVRDALPDASVLKIGMYPLPRNKIRAFAAKVKKLYVIEELDPIIENEVRAMGIPVIGKEIFPEYGELFSDVIRKSLGMPVGGGTQDAVISRPPVLCKGCGHIPVFEVLRDIGATVLGDIGCYTLGALPPFGAMDTTVCMGASVGNEAGFKKAARLAGKRLNSVAVIGDSTFFHSGMTNLLDAVYNRTPVTVLILDNRITAMTGHQANPNTGLDNRMRPAPRVDIEQVVRGLGVKRVRKVNAYRKDEVRQAIEEENAADEPSVIIADEVCVIAEARLRKLTGKA